MARLLISESKINGLTAALFVLVEAALWYLHYPRLWEGMMIAAGIAMVIRQFLLGRMFGLLLSVVVFGGAWASLFFDYRKGQIIPILAAAGAIYVLGVQIAKYYQRQPRLREEPPPVQEAPHDETE